MKTYTFSIETEDFSHNGNFISDLKNEVKDELKQRNLTYKINLETTQVHKQILGDMVEVLNSELSKVGLEFGDHRFEGNTNNYQNSMVRILDGVNNWGFVLAIVGENERNFEGSKYTTYTGKYRFKIIRNDSQFYTANQLYKDGLLINAVEDIFKRMKDDVKKHIEKSDINLVD